MQVLGSLVTLVGSGVNYAVSSALETMGLLVSDYARELIPLSPHISGTIFVIDLLNLDELFRCQGLHNVFILCNQAYWITWKDLTLKICTR